MSFYEGLALGFVAGLFLTVAALFLYAWSNQ